MSSLRFKIGGLLAVVLCWSLLMVYLVTLLEWVPAPFTILQSQFTDPSIRPATTTTFFTSVTSRIKTEPPTSRALSTEDSRHLESAVRVLIASDGFCLGGLVSAVNSVLQHTRHAVKFYIITTTEELPHLRKWIEATKLHKMTYELHTLTALTKNISGGLQQVKIRATELFPELWDRLVYLDCDVIVQGDIWELFMAEIRPGDYGAFSQNCVGPVGRVMGVPLVSSVKKPRYGAYINLRHSALNNSNINQDACPLSTGVFVANLTLWRWHGVTEKLQHWLKIHKGEKIVGNLPTVDVVEAAMLIVLYGKVTVLDPLWHVQHLGASYSSRYSKQFIERAKLLHWNGQFKPWSHRVAHAEVWDRYYIPDPTAQFRPARKRG